MDSIAPEVAPEEDFLIAVHEPEHAAEDSEIAKAQEVIAGCYRVTCPEIVLVSAPGTQAEVASVRRALQERGGEHIKRWRHEETRGRARQAAVTHARAVTAPRMHEVSRTAETLRRI